MASGTPESTAASPLQLCVVLPTFNEADNLASLVARLDAALTGIAWEAIIVDDDSKDGTADAARALSLTDRRVRVIQRIGRRGLASAAIEGMCATAAPHVAVMDADHQHDPGPAAANAGGADFGRLRPRLCLALCRGGEHGRLEPTRPGACFGPRQFARAAADRGAVDRSDERLFHAARRDRAGAGAAPFGRRLQDPARYPCHGRAAAQGQGVSAAVRRARGRREQARPGGGVRIPRRALRQVARADHPDPVCAVRDDRRGGRRGPHGGARLVPEPVRRSRSGSASGSPRSTSARLSLRLSR